MSWGSRRSSSQSWRNGKWWILNTETKFFFFWPFNFLSKCEDKRKKARKELAQKLKATKDEKKNEVDEASVKIDEDDPDKVIIFDILKLEKN